MKGPLDIHQFLLAHDVHHEIVRLPSTNASGNSDLAAALGLPPRRCVAVHPFHAVSKTIDLLVLLLTTSDTLVDDATIANRLAKAIPNDSDPTGDLVVFARANTQLVSGRTDYLAGHVAPLLLPADVVVVATQSLADLAATVVYTPTGDVGTALGLRAADLLALAHATVLSERARATRRRSARIDLDSAQGPPAKSAAGISPVAS